MKMISPLFLVLLTLFMFKMGWKIGQSQTFEWIHSQSFNYTYNPDMVQYTVASDHDGNIVYAGMDYFNTYYSEMYGTLFLKKYTPEGEALFVKEILGNAMVDHLMSGSDNDYFLTGQFRDSIHFENLGWYYTSANSDEYFMAVFDEDGNAESFLNLSVMIPDLYEISLFSFDNQNNLYLGVASSGGSQIIKMDVEGNFLLTIEQQSVSMINSVDVDPAGNILVSGAFAAEQSYFGGELFEVSTQDNMYVAKYDALGQVQWVKFVIDVIYTFHNQIKCDLEGNTYFSGFLFAPVQFGDFQTNGPDWVYDFFLTKLDSDGEFQWVVEVPENEALGDASVGKLHFMDVDTDNNVYISGFVRGTIDWGNGVVSTGDIYNDLLLLKFSPEGIIQWSKSGGSESFVKSLALSIDDAHNCYMAGIGGGEMVFDTITHYQEGWEYPFIIKMNADQTSGFTNWSTKDYDFNVFPNPASGSIQLAFEGNITASLTVNLYSASGQKLKTQTYPDGSSAFQMNLPSYEGLMFIEIQFEDGRLLREKFLCY